MLLIKSEEKKIILKKLLIFKKNRFKRGLKGRIFLKINTTFNANMV